MDPDRDDGLARAAESVARAEALLIGAGAGMGVDSGLPDFRGPEGFWRAYPAARRLNLSFVEMANPRWFRDDPRFAWGFYGHRRNLYRATVPHGGFAILRRWADRMPNGAFVFTSNIDDHFRRAGFDAEAILECHGSIERDQCLADCGVSTAGPDPIDVDEETLRAAEPLPRCGRCGGLARPNILMFGDWDWDPSVAEDQELRFSRWQRRAACGPVAVVECGAGTAVPTVRSLCERAARAFGTPLIRINLRDPEVPPGQVGLAMGALDALGAIDRLLTTDRDR